MVSCYFILNSAEFSRLSYNGRHAQAFSGNGIYRNKPQYAGIVNNGPIPPGLYYIVDRESGGLFGPLRDFFTGRDEWFALYRQDGTIDDEMFINGVRRGEFRLHPIGPARTSLGCITLQSHTEFDRMRSYLLQAPVTTITRTRMRTYGTVSVGYTSMPSLLPHGHAYA